MLFCDGDEHTPPAEISPLIERLTAEERLSLCASERRGRLAVSCCVSSITTVGDEVLVPPAVSDGPPPFTVSLDEASSELTLKPSTGVLAPVTTGLDGPDEEAEPPRLKPARERLGKGEPRPTELELSRRNESRCCLFSLSRNFFSLLLTPVRKRFPVLSILTGEMPFPPDGDDPPVSEEKLSDDSV